MKNGLQLTLALAIIATLTGCSTPYMIDRRRDAADIVTLGVGAGLGAKARVGFLQTGLLVEKDLIALRGGEFVRIGVNRNGEHWVGDADFLFVYFEAFKPQALMPPYPQRGKTFKTEFEWSWIPFVHLVDGGHNDPPCYSYPTQIDVVGALGGSVRVGVNPGELLDFVLGWTTLDIYKDDIRVDGDYSYNVDRGQTTITGVDAAYTGALSITNTLGGYPVTRIGDRAFDGCTNLTDVTIPASVTRIEAGAFEFLSWLNSITVDAANTAYSSDMGGVVFNKEKSKLIRYPRGKAGEYVIPTSVNQIGCGAFEGCAGLTSVTIPDGVAVIESCAFENCANLTSVKIPDSVTSIGYMAFEDCSNLATIALPSQLSELGWSAFEGCTNLISIAIPGGVAKIENWTFQGCGALSNVTIRDGVTRIGWGAFDECSSLVEITIPASVTKIGAYAFSACPALTCVRFEGNAPRGASDTSIFGDSSSNVTVYYRPGTKGWGKTFGGRPTAVWKQ